MNKFVKILLIISIIVGIVGIGFLGYGYYLKLTRKVNNPLATIEVENYGTIKVELYPDMAPNTVTNFIRLANRNFYDGKDFHRTIPNFMIQGGSNGEEKGNPVLANIKDNASEKEYAIEGEFIANGFNKNILKLKKGVIAMARADYSNLSPALTKNGYDSAGSQFFIMQEDNENLNGLYAGFGKVIEGLDVVDKIANVEVKSREQGAEGQDEPVNKPVIKSIRVETFGVDYGEPKTMEPFDYYKWMMSQYPMQQQEELTEELIEKQKE